MEWYLPLTFLPSLGLIIMSTANQLMSLSSEINQILGQDCDGHQKTIAERKIAQLERLTRSLSLLYFSSVCFTLSGLVQFFTLDGWFSKLTLVLGTGTFFLSLIVLTLYGMKTVSIRKFQFQMKH